MNLDPLVVPRHEARAKAAEYAAAARATGDPTDVGLARVYRRTLKGDPVIRLPEAIAAAGRFPNGLPRLAVVRANATRCFVSLNRWGGVDRLTFKTEQDIQHLGGRVGARHVLVNVPTPPDAPSQLRSSISRQRWEGSTLVPLVPPRYRPTRPRLSSCHVLWEVEEWGPIPPVDPALLRHIHGDLWAVLATWELTELERAVLPGRGQP